MEIKCNKDIVFNGLTYAKKGEMVEIVSVGTQFSFNGTNGLFFSMSVDYVIQHFDKKDVQNAIDTLLKNK